MFGNVGAPLLLPEACSTSSAEDAGFQEDCVDVMKRCGTHLGFVLSREAKEEALQNMKAHVATAYYGWAAALTNRLHRCLASIARNTGCALWDEISRPGLGQNCVIFWDLCELHSGPLCVHMYAPTPQAHSSSPYWKEIQLLVRVESFCAWHYIAHVFSTCLTTVATVEHEACKQVLLCPNLAFSPRKMNTYVKDLSHCKWVPFF